MMTNLFSMFDPSSSIIIPLNWFSTLFIFMFIPPLYWFTPNSFNLIYSLLMLNLFKEFKIIINNNKNNNFTLIFISLFLFIMLNNFIGLFPYIFTSTSHLILNLTMALPLWLSFMMFGWIKMTNNMFIHLVPQGTPLILIPFMVCIESISNIIRPITLTVRLTANMIAGHLLMTLLGNMGPIINTSLIPILLSIQIMLLILESAVAIIQSYVFSVLMILYISEI